MIKYLLFLLPSFTLFEFMFQTGATVTDNLPATMDAGSAKVVEFQIDKGNHAGFAKLQLDIPFGFTVKAVESKGASFTFSGQIAKFIWMTLPTETSFKVKMELSAAPSLTGAHPFKGQFSYIDNNQRVDYNLPVKTVTIGAPADAMASAEGNIGQSGAESTTAVMQGEINNNCYREVTDLGGGKYSVKVTVKDLGVKGYAKLEEKMTANAIITSKKSMGAVVTTDKNFIKFVWFDAPQTPEFSVEYEVSGPDAALYINGKFGYVKSNAPTEEIVGITPSYVEMMAAINGKQADTSATATAAALPNNTNSEKAKSDSVAAAEKQLAESKKQQELIAEAKKQEALVEAKKQQEAAAEAKKQQELKAEAKKKEAEAKKQQEAAAAAEAKKQQELTAEAKKKEAEAKKKDADIKKQQELEAAKNATAEAKKDNDLKNISKAPAPEVGVTYKVQIVAAHRTVGKEYFVSRHKFYDAFNIENHEGWVKYTTGKFGVYADARNAREEIRSKYDFDGPFVTAYNQGERITVQEALMISNQQWVK